MSDDEGFYYCLKHKAVEPKAGCKGEDRLGPYKTRAEAEKALDRVAERNEEWEAEDRRWKEGES
ncbi:MAG: hypothetical protein M3Z02_02850 [Actinomycetota bacterium]|nr:hypothetical protein [Actinomycetota bacterium]